MYNSCLTRDAFESKRRAQQLTATGEHIWFLVRACEEKAWRNASKSNSIKLPVEYFCAARRMHLAFSVGALMSLEKFRRKARMIRRSSFCLWCLDLCILKGLMEKSQLSTNSTRKMKYKGNYHTLCVVQTFSCSTKLLQDAWFLELIIMTMVLVILWK